MVHSWIKQKSRFQLWFVALMTGFVGVVNLLSAVTDGLPGRVHHLKHIFPFLVLANARMFSALAGFFLLTLAANLLRRKRFAWLMTMGLLVISILSHLLKGWDYEEGMLCAVLLGQLLLMRREFTAESDRPSIAHGLRLLLAALLFTIVYGTAGLYFLDRHYAINFDLIPALFQTLAMFFILDNDGLQPTTRLGAFFANSIYTISIITFGYALLSLLRPVLMRGDVSADDRAAAQTIVEQYGNSSLARLTLLDDKRYYFSPSGQTVIAYVAKGRGAIALGDPIGPFGDRLLAIAGFQQFCDRNDWYPAFYQVLPDDLGVYQSLGLRALKIGEEAIVDLTTFTLEGKPGRKLRSSLNTFTKAGYTIQFYQSPIDTYLLEQLRGVSDEWLRMMQGAEKRFSLGWFDEAYLRDCEIVVVYTPQGKISAFANIIPEYQRNEITIDLMRHCQDMENGTMDFLFLSLLGHFKTVGYQGFNLGLSALAGMSEDDQAPRLEKSIHYLQTHLSRFYNFQGISRYKEKFHPRWESRYLIYPNIPALPEVVLALVRADSDDRLLDYFKPGFDYQALGRRLLQFLPSLFGILLLGASIWVITQQLAQYKPQEIWQSLTMISGWRLGAAITLTLFSCLVFGFYDVLAMRYVRQSGLGRKPLFVGFASTVVGNNVGLALLSSSAIRYRFYGPWGLSAGQITQVIGFCNLSFWLGLFLAGGIVFVIQPIAVPVFLHLPFSSVRPIGVIFLSVVLAYVGLTRLGRRWIGMLKLPRLSGRLCLGQLAIASADWILAAAVMYSLLPDGAGLSYGGFFSIYLLAQLGGIVSNVPGGVGVFETVILLLLAPMVSPVVLAGPLLAHRVIYYFMPLGMAIAMMSMYEVRKRASGQ